MLVGVDFDIERGDDLGGGGGLVFDIGDVFEKFRGDGNARSKGPWRHGIR